MKSEKAYFLKFHAFSQIPFSKKRSEKQNDSSHLFVVISIRNLSSYWKLIPLILSGRKFYSSTTRGGVMFLVSFLP